MNDDIDNYDEAGFCLVKGMVPATALPVLREEILGRIEALKSSPDYANYKSGKYREFAVGLHMQGAAVTDLLRSEPFAALASRLLGPDVDLRFTSTMTKTAEKNCALDWHQDDAYARDPEHPKFSFWIAVTPSTKANGCLRVIPGSHLQGLVPHVASRLFPPDKEVETLDESGALDVEMEAGDAIILHPCLIHASWPNVSGDLRIGLIAGFMRPKAAYLDFELKASYAYLRNHLPRWEKIAAAPTSAS